MHVFFIDLCIAPGPCRAGAPHSLSTGLSPRSAGCPTICGGIRYIPNRMKCVAAMGVGVVE